MKGATSTAAQDRVPALRRASQGKAWAGHRVLAPAWGCIHGAEHPALPRSRLHSGLLSPMHRSRGSTWKGVSHGSGGRFCPLWGAQDRVQPRGSTSPSSLPSPSWDTALMSTLGCWEGTSLHPSVVGEHSQ